MVPRTWEADGDHLAWTTEIRHGGHSTPVIGGGKIWLTSATEDGKQQFVDALDATTGEVLHHRTLFENASPEPLGNPVNNYAAPTPVLQSDGLYVHFGTYGTARLDVDSGATVWQRRDINVRHFRGPGSSPVIVDDLLILTFDGIDHQFVVALDKETGETVWKTDRTTDYGDLGEDGLPLREGDLRKAYSTPAIMTVGDSQQVISVGSRAAFGYDAVTGREIWTLRHDDYNAAAQPLVFEDKVIINTGSRGAELIAIRVDDSTRGDVTDSHVVWNHDRGNSRLSFPVLVATAAGGQESIKPMVVWITDNGVASAVDARTGRSLWAKRMGGNYVASPLVMGDRVAFFSSDGESVLTKVDAQGIEILARNPIGEDLTASPAVASDGLILRTGNTVSKLVRSSR